MAQQYQRKNCLSNVFLYVCAEERFHTLHKRIVKPPLVVSFTHRCTTNLNDTEFTKTVISFALAGYEIVNNQLASNAGSCNN